MVGVEGARSVHDRFEFEGTKMTGNTKRGPCQCCGAECRNPEGVIAPAASLPDAPTDAMREAAAYYLGRSIDIEPTWRAMIAAIPPSPSFDRTIAPIDREQMLEAEVIKLRSNAATPLRDALEFGIWSVSGPTNDQEFERLERIIEESWQDFLRQTSVSRPDDKPTYTLCACGLETWERCVDIGCPDAKESKRGRKAVSRPDRPQETTE